MKTILALTALVLAWHASAGWFGGGDNVDSNEQLALLFGDNTAFTATADITVLNKQGKTRHGAEMEYAFLDGKLWTELNMAKTKAGQKHAEGMNEMAAMGMDRIVTLIRPDKQLTYIIYPGIQSYCESPVTAGRERQPPKIEKQELGNDTLDGRPCVKSLVTITDNKGRQTQMTVWQATDLKDFPVQSEMTKDGETIVTTFKNIKLEKPAASLFDVPTNYTKYATVNEMMMGAMQKIMGQQFGQ